MDRYEDFLQDGVDHQPYWADTIWPLDINLLLPAAAAALNGDKETNVSCLRLLYFEVHVAVIWPHFISKC